MPTSCARGSSPSVISPATRAEGGRAGASRAGAGSGAPAIYPSCASAWYPVRLDSEARSAPGDGAEGLRSRTGRSDMDVHYARGRDQALDLIRRDPAQVDYWLGRARKG